MKKIFYFVLFITTFTFVTSITEFDTPYVLIAVKARTGKSRFGDCLSIISFAWYLSKKYQLPIIFDYFNYCQDLLINDEIKKNKELFDQKKFKHVIRLKTESDIKLDGINHEDTLYEVDVNFKTDEEAPEVFKKVDVEFKKFIKPIRKINSEIPEFIKNNKDYITIALHVRRGGGAPDDPPLLSKDGLNNVLPDKKNWIDAEHFVSIYRKRPFKFSDLRFPLKFPPDSYYIQQIQKIAEIYKDKKIFVHIFTDDKNPKFLSEKYERFLNNKNITFSCREKDNSHDKNIIDDFFALTEFDCLIRADSKFSIHPERLANFKIIVWPCHAYWVEKDWLYIDSVKLKYNNLNSK